MITVGAAVEPLGITSPVPMSGFAARTEPSAGEHDVLGARALAMDEIVLIAIDVCALEEGTCRAIAGGVRPEAPEQVIVTATHTHAGPCSTPTRLTRCEPEIEQAIIDAAIAAGASARGSRRSCTMEYRAAHGVGVAFDRRHADRAVDPPVQMLQFTAVGSGGVPGGAGAGRVVASLLTYPCHPVVLDGTNRLLSGDYVHPLRERIEAENPGSIAVFATGCAGDINTGHSAEASYSLQGSTSRTFAEAHRVGTRVAEAALAADPAGVGTAGEGASAADPMGAGTAGADPASGSRDMGPASLVTAPVTVAMTRPDAARVAEDSAAWTRDLATAEPGRATLLSLWLDWARAVPEGADWTGRVSAFRLGDVTVVALPGEPFLAVAEQISAQVDGPCVVLGYADGCPGYFPTMGEYPHGGYEVEDAHRYYGMPGPFAAGSAEILVEKAVEVCRALG
ncbi:hypothetical protein [Brachybacterium sacelli]|uniref:Alkaline ceramidase n=1 Tax=Brachybacterium sacelli TaxID=173364 RepID=A0ABS4WZ32_9MICO|nr:hypothetical protein [Brachybacterium sacelli]MBP2381460.1 hypothetical protein [Brachybacterium sacelli]